MPDSRIREIESVFDDVVERPTAERLARLAERCGDDAALRAEVEALLRAHERAEGILERDAAGPARSAMQDPLRGRRIGP
jgi:eukaryotic-like serine/threonine-protein kinase